EHLVAALERCRVAERRRFVEDEAKLLRQGQYLEQGPAVGATLQGRGQLGRGACVVLLLERRQPAEGVSAPKDVGDALSFDGGGRRVGGVDGLLDGRRIIASLEPL